MSGDWSEVGGSESIRDVPGLGVPRLLQRALKPWFVWQPAQVVRRALLSFFPPGPGYQPVRTSWGATITADRSLTIGKSIVATGVYDLAVTEALARLIAPGDLVVDAGANVGYMTALATLAAGPRGTVISFEPHPRLFGVLEQNVAEVHRLVPAAKNELLNQAVGDTAGTVQLELPADFGSNDGVARVVGNSATNSAATTIPVAVTTLDAVLAGRFVGVMKIDIEGYEETALRGARATLDRQRIRHILFEDHNHRDSAVVRLLESYGYRVFSLGWGLFGPRIRPISEGSLAASYEAANFIATIAPEALQQAMAPRGWVSLTDGLVRRCRNDQQAESHHPAANA